MWVTTKDGRHFNTDWLDKDRQIEASAEEAKDRNGKSPEEMLDTFEKLKDFGNKDKKTGEKPFKLNPLMDTSDAAKEANKVNLSMQGKERDKGKIESVSMKDVGSTQPWVSKAAIRNAIKNPEGHKYSGDIVGIRCKGRVILVDGNHRAILAYLRGDKEIKIRIMKEV